MKTSALFTLLITINLLTVHAQTNPAWSAATISTNTASAWRQSIQTKGFTSPASKASWKGNINKVSLAGSFTTTNRPTIVSTAIAERGYNHRVVKSVMAQTNPDGKVSYRTNSYTELTTGMHYLENGEWKETRELIEPVAGGAIAQYGPHKVIFAENLNTAGAIDLETPDAKRLRSHILGLSYYDSSSGKSVLIAEVKDSRGEIVNSNQVVYADAFTGIKADVRFKYTKAGFEQDIILRAQPPSPKEFGLNPDTTRLQVLTEFLDPPSPVKSEQVLNLNKGAAMRDESLDFGVMQMGEGRTFLLGHENEARTPVAKQWQKIDGRDILTEEVALPSLTKKLEALPKSASLSAPNKNARLAKLERQLPGARKTAEKGQKMLLAKLEKKELGLVLDWVALSSQNGYTLAGDTTYYVSGPVFLGSGRYVTTIEGGTVVKFANSSSAKITMGGIQVLKTGPYRPAIFTSMHDNSVGDVIDESSGQPEVLTGVTFLENVTFAEYLYFRYAGTTVGTPVTQTGYQSSSTSEFRHCQFISCNQAIAMRCEGQLYSSLVLRNVLFSDCTTPVYYNLSSPPPDGSNDGYLHATLVAEHVTADNLQSFWLNPLPGWTYYFTTVRNCLFTRYPSSVLTAMSDAAGGYEGSFANESSQEQPDASCFAPTGPGGGLFFIANGQGAYYLQANSPFVDAGTTNIDPGLKSDLAKLTTMVPEEFIDDVNTSMTLSQTQIRDTDTPDLGYHYPAIDYVVTFATVNNATLNIDQGTVLAYTDPWVTWGLRINPGGRLNVNGVPTNRVVFARLEAVQENPLGWSYFDPLITFKGIVIPGGSAVTPLAEANLRYADFPAVGFWNMHIGPMSYWDWTYQLVSNLTLDGCHFENGYVLYDSTGSVGRKLTFRNSIFARTVLGIISFWSLPLPEEEEQFDARNNLFYYGHVNLLPLSGDNWTFTDNIFDHVSFEGGEPGSLYNGPVAVNHHNAYVGMTDRLSPAAPTTTDPDLVSLNYATGPLGRFYLPTSATVLIDKGSRLAADAGLYHFTSLTTNVKEGNEAANPKTVNIGPHYLALVSGSPPDADSDNTPDYAEDRNGNGIVETDETDWQAPDTDAIKFLGTYQNALAGLVTFNVWAADLQNLKSIALSIDGKTLEGISGLTPPFTLPLTFDLDTRRLANGAHTLQLSASWPGAITPVSFASDPLNVSIDNPFAFPSWTGGFEPDPSKLNVNTPAADADYTIYIFDASYPISDDPWPMQFVSGVTAGDGSVAATWDMQGYEDADSYPFFCSITELAGGAAQAVVNPASPQVKDNYPSEGMWGVAVLDWLSHDLINYSAYEGNNNNLAAIGETLGGVLPPSGQTANGGLRFYGKPLYIRLTSAFPSLTPTDWSVLYSTVFSDPRVRNFIYDGHAGAESLGEGPKGGFGGLGLGLIAATLNNNQPGPKNQRYRFVWLDGCNTANGSWPAAFGLGKTENKSLAAYKGRPGLFIGWDNEPGLAYSPIGGGPNAQGILTQGGVVQEYQNFRARFLLRLSSLYNYNVQDAWNDSFYLMPAGLHTHFKMYGYWGLRLGHYNHASDWP